MVRKRFLVGLIIAIVFANVLYWIQQNDVSKENIIANTLDTSKSESIQETSAPQQIKPVVPKYDLYSETPYDLPLTSIYEISKLSKTVKKSIDKILELSQGFYYLKQIDDKVFVILQNPAYETDTYTRHGLQIAEISQEGKITYHTAGYSGINGELSLPEETETDTWVYDKSIEPYRPLKHIAYDEKGKIKFTEIWNYSPDENIKYEMKDAKNKTISILKETIETETNYRKEHIFYDNEGNTLVSISINFDEANITRFNYYNAKKPNSSVIIMCDYVDGNKTFEKVYDKDYNLVNIFESAYKDGTRNSISIFDPEKNKLGTINS